MSGKLFADKHSWTTLRMSRPLFVGSFCRSRGGLLANEKEEKLASNDNANYLFIFEEGNCVFLSGYLCSVPDDLSLFITRNFDEIA